MRWTMRIDELPAEMQKMSAQQRREHLARVATARTRLLREAADLNRLRDAFLVCQKLSAAQALASRT